MKFKIDPTIKLDHLVTLSIALVCVGFIYASVQSSLESKADKTDVIANKFGIEKNRADISQLRLDTSDDIKDIKNILIRMEDKMQKKVDK